MTDRRLALLVGTNQYDDAGLAQLRSPAGDVEALARVLNDPCIGGFETRAPLIDREKRDVEYELEDFFSEAGPADLLVAYLSCHGVLAEDGRLYFAARDSERRRLRATAISDWFIHDLMTQSRARQSVLILDCCHSGAFAKGLVRKGDIDLNLDNRFKGKGQVILTASNKMEFAFEGSGLQRVSGEGKRSVFTAAVVEGLSTGNADINGDGKVTVEELYDFVYGRVKAETPNQTPGMSGDVRGGIVIATSILGPRPGRPTVEVVAEPTWTFDHVWYRPEGTRGEDMLKMKAMTDRGTLRIWPNRLSFKGKWIAVEIANIRRVTRSRSGKDFINSFVIVEYGDGQTAQFADGRNIGWSGMLGGNRKIQEAIERSISR